MVINNVQLFNGNAVCIGIAGDKITSVTGDQNGDDPFQLYFDDALAFPGLINSHDHLDFNLFPMLGDGTYNNYTEWGNSIHKAHKYEIDKVLKIPEQLRTEWGIYKNLLCGVTTVINHGKHLSISHPLINILQAFQSLHSVKFEKYWKVKLNNPMKKNIPCAIHAGEGTDNQSEEEINELIRWNYLRRELIAIHGVAMTEQQAKKIRALVWCPASNYFLFNKTASINNLKHHTEICFGTDSTLTNDWNIWEHVRLARKNDRINDTELFEMLTSTPANVCKLNSGFIAEGKNADIVVAKATGNFNKNFYSLNPEDILLVIHDGNIRLFDKSLEAQLKDLNFMANEFSRIEINGAFKFVQGNLSGLLSKVKNYYKEAVFPVTVC